MSSSQTSPPSMRPGGLIMRRIASAMVDLPEPDSPARPKRSCGRRLKDDIVHRAHRAERMVVGDAQALDPQHRGVHTDRRSRGLAISSSPTVRKNRPRNTIRIMTMGAIHHHHQPLMIAALKLTQ